MVGLENLSIIQEIPEARPKVVTLWGTFFLLLENKNAVNKDAILKEIEELDKHIASAEQKLANERFTAHAPEAVVTGVRKLMEENIQKREALKKLLE